MLVLPLSYRHSLSIVISLCKTTGGYSVNAFVGDTGLDSCLNMGGEIHLAGDNTSFISLTSASLNKDLTSKQLLLEFQ
ncbi:hypothetical protein ACQP3J_31445, partial [Escherichia coli]